MTHYEYKVVPAPARGQKAKGVKSPQGRFANALESLMNKLAADGWEFQRTETLPSEERTGLTSSTTTYRSVMVFRRRRAGDPSEYAPRQLEPPKLTELPPPAAPAAVQPDATGQNSVDGNSENENTPADDTAAQTLGLDEDRLAGASAERDPDEGESVTSISVALRARAKARPDT